MFFSSWHQPQQGWTSFRSTPAPLTLWAPPEGLFPVPSQSILLLLCSTPAQSMILPWDTAHRFPKALGQHLASLGQGLGGGWMSSVLLDLSIPICKMEKCQKSAWNFVHRLHMVKRTLRSLDAQRWKQWHFIPFYTVAVPSLALPFLLADTFMIAPPGLLLCLPLSFSITAIPLPSLVFPLRILIQVGSPFLVSHRNPNPHRND